MTDFGKVASFWHRIAREQTVDRADDATLEMFEGLTLDQVNEALRCFDSDGERVSA